MFRLAPSAPGRLLLAGALILVGARAFAAEQAAPEPAPLTATPMSTAELAEAERLAQGVTIYRDSYGVPHIHGQSDQHVTFGFAYAQAEDFFWQIEDNYILGLGRYSEVHGFRGLNSDLLNRSFEVVPQSRAHFGKLEPKIQSSCAAFALGLNYYLAKHPETTPRLITHFEPWHVLTYGRQLMLELCFRYTRLSHNYLPRTHDMIWSAAGSNGWAISGSRTKSGHPMLFVNPHLPWFGFGQMYEAHLRSDEGWAFTGSTMYGSCVPTMGHNEHLGWTFTTNEPDIADLWRVTFDDPKNPLKYRYGDGYRDATEWKETIKIKSGKDFRERVVLLRKTHYGPVVVKEDDQHFLAARIAGQENASMLRQQLELVKAKNFAEFKKGLELQQFPIMNVLYADKDDNIFYLYNGMVPKRDPSFNWSKPVDGADTRTEWQGLHTLDEMPQLFNPADGYVQNCNSSPFTTCNTGNLDRTKYPPYMVEDADDDKRRAKISRQLLGEMKSVSFEDVEVAAFDTTVYWAQQELPKYGEHLEALQKTNPALAAKVAPYLEHLLKWDCRVTAESTEATLCEAWYEELYGINYPAETLKPRFANDPAAALRALVTAAEKITGRYGKWKTPWASVFRIQRQNDMIDLLELPFDDHQASLPSLGTPGPMGVVFTQYYSPTIKLPFIRNMGKRYGILGVSYMAVYEFGPKIRGASALNFGVSGDPKSPHYFDQAKLLSECKLKPELFYWPDVLAGAKVVYHPGETPKVLAAK